MNARHRHSRVRSSSPQIGDGHAIRAVYRQAASDRDGRWTTVEIGLEYSVSRGEQSANHEAALSKLAAVAQVAVTKAGERVEHELAVALDRPRYDRIMAQVRRRLTGRPWHVPTDQSDEAIRVLVKKWPGDSSEAERLCTWLAERSKRPLPLNWPWAPPEAAITVIADGET